MRKIVFCTFLVVLFVALLSTTALADSNVSGIVTIDTNWAGTLQQAVEATGITRAIDVAELHITDTVTNTLTDDDISYINSMHNIEVLDVAETVTVGHVADNFLYDELLYNNLRSVTFPATSFGNYAFRNCAVLTSICLPAAVSFGNNAFSNSDVLTSVSLPAVESFGGYAFYDCDALISISLPAAVSFGDNAFKNCDALTSISLPAAKSFGNSAFYNCDALTLVSLPAAVSFGNYAFSSSDALISVSLPVAESFGKYTFFDCNALISVSLPAAISFGDYAFIYCDTLTSVSLPAAKSFGDSAFYDCDSLNSISLPAVESFDDGAFADCNALTSVSLPAAKSFGDYAFTNCNALTSVSLPATESFGNSVFNDCVVLTSVSLPKVSSIGSDIFYRSPNIYTIDFGTHVISNVDFSKVNKKVRLIGGTTVPLYTVTNYVPQIYDSEIIAPYGLEIDYDIYDGTLNGKWHGFRITLSYIITYNGNENTSGTVPTDASYPYIESNTVTVMDKADLVRDGYTFIGWNTQQDGNGISYNKGDTFDITANTTLYAQWETIPDTCISFDLANSTTKMNVGVTASLDSLFKYIITPAIAPDKQVSWQSSNPNVASITGGMLTVNSVGITKIKVYLTNTPALFTEITLAVEDISQPIPPETRVGTISGKLIDNSGNPLTGYPITLCSDPITVITDSQGTFTFTGIPYTPHMLIVNNPSLLEISRFTVGFTKGGTTSSTIDNALNTIGITYDNNTLNVEVLFQTNATLNDVDTTDITFKQKQIDLSQKVENPETGEICFSYEILLFGYAILTLLIVLIFLKMKKSKTN